MSTIDIIRAWKDEDYRSSLSDADRTQLPDNPAGLVELSYADLKEVGGATSFLVCFPTLPICMTFTLATFCPTMYLCVAPENEG